MKVYCINAIQPLPADRRCKVDVRMELVLAESLEQAMAAVANSRPYYEGNWRLKLRNTFEPGEVFTWSYQTWERNEVDNGLPTVAETRTDGETRETWLARERAAESKEVKS